MSDHMEIFETHPLMDRTPLVDEGVTKGGDDSEILLKYQARVLKIAVRGKLDNPGFTGAIENVLEFGLPVTPNTVNRNKMLEALWLGPDEWLVRTLIDSADSLRGSTSAEELVASIQSAASGNHCAIVDVSDYYCVLELDSGHTLDILEKISPLDVVSALPDTSSCAQTRVGNAPVLLSRSGESGRLYSLQVRWSYAEYLWDYIAEAAMEYLEPIGH